MAPAITWNVNSYDMPPTTGKLKSMIVTLLFRHCNDGPASLENNAHELTTSMELIRVTGD
ncbi:MAG: hypothetical protein JSS82_13920 [Bacteroidetes bacterium]|nr:hypothetical protein [Bacteroidota bacterium]